VDVVTDLGRTEISFDLVKLADLGREPRPVSLRFELSGPRELEFRVYVRGRDTLLIGDNPHVTKLPEGSALRFDPMLEKRILRHLFVADGDVRIREGRVTIETAQVDLPVLMRFDDPNRDILAEQIVRMVGYRGDGENSLYRAFVGTERPSISPPTAVPFSSSLCQQAHFALDQYRFWAAQLKESPKYQRKQWEFIYIAQALYERGLLATGKRGLVFGAGQEQLPALFASFGVAILATDQAADAAQESGWSATSQHTFDLSALNQRGICTDRMFSELVSFRAVDMNDIPPDLNGQFDFCWSACALEHLGSLEHGLRFIENSLRTLRPGGVAVHTTEFNLSSNDETMETQHCCYYRRRDLEVLERRLTSAGYSVAPFDWSTGEGFAERVVDLPPFAGRGEPHIRLRVDAFDTTSIGLIVTKQS
jgi:SAM-dependent methyltransferase